MTRDIFGKLQSPICGTVEHVAMTNELRAGYLRSRVAVSNKDVVNAPLPPLPKSPSILRGVVGGESISVDY